MVFARLSLGLLVGLMLVGPASAEETCSGPECSQADDSSCQPVNYKSGELRISVNPLLGWWTINPWSCIGGATDLAEDTAETVIRSSQTIIHDILGW